MTIEMSATDFGDTVSVDAFQDVIGITVGTGIYLTLNHQQAENLRICLTRMFPKSITARKPYDVDTYSQEGAKL